MAQKKKMGRPPVRKKFKRSIQMSVSVTESELRRLKSAAEKEGLSISELLLRPWRQEGE